MTALKIGAPKDYMRQLNEHADTVNLPRIGVDENVAFPAVQANVAPAVALNEALGIQYFNLSNICLLTCGSGPLQCMAVTSLNLTFLEPQVCVFYTFSTILIFLQCILLTTATMSVGIRETRQGLRHGYLFLYI
jgi:hypothetical protein